MKMGFKEGESFSMTRWVFKKEDYGDDVEEVVFEKVGQLLCAYKLPSPPRTQVLEGYLLARTIYCGHAIC